MKNLFGSFVVAFSMYSKIPMPKRDWTKENMEYAMCFFPLIGGVIGLLCYAWFNLCVYFSVGKILFAAGMVLIPALVSGGIHLDGFCDTIDALSSHQAPERKLEILKDPNAGAFAVIGCILYILTTFALFCEIEINIRIIVILGCGFVISRSLSGLSVVSFKNARGTGTLATFSDMAKKTKVKIVLTIYIVLAVLLIVDINMKLALAVAVAAGVVFAYYRYMSYKEFGGITGDLAGYFLQMCELFILVAVVGYGII